jgi:beta-xylosidase
MYMSYIYKPKAYFRYKKTLGILLAVLLFFSQGVSVGAWQSDNGDGTFTNPPLYADYPDPSIIRVGNYFYLATSTFVNVPGLVICRSEDLVNWEIAGHCITALTGNNAYNMIGGVKYGGGCFAPSIAYKNGTFYVAVTLNGEATRIYSAKDVSGPWKVSTLSGSYFDPAIFIEDDGTPYLAYGGAWQNQISMIQLNSDLSATIGSSRVILSYNNVEGSHLVKANGRYYLFNAVPAQKLVCSRANSVWGPYGETITLCTAGKGGHQGGIVDLPDGSYWGYLHQDDGAIGRPTRICPITWQNGWPMFGRPGFIGQVESKYTKPIANKPVKVPAASDEFNGSSLGLQWMWNHNPDNTKWSLTGSALRLKASTGSDFWHARNSLTQKGQGPVSSGSIKVDCSKMQSGDICGLGMLGDPRGFIAVTRDPKRIIMSEEDVVKATVNNITSDILYFRVEMNFNNNKARFFWKDDEAKSWQPLGTTITMGFDWQYGTFQGEQYAILNYNPGASTGYCDIDWFRLNDTPGPDENPTPVPTSVPTLTPDSRSAFSQIEAEDFDSQSGTRNEACSEGGEDVGYIEDGDYVVYNNINFGAGAKSFHARTASGSNGGNIEIRLDSITGPLVGTCTVTGNGDWQTWYTATCDVSGVSGVHDLYLKFTGGSGYLLNLNWWKFIAVDDTPAPTSTPVKSIDVNHDGAINISDVMIVAGAFNCVGGDSRYVEAYDLNNDGAINITDIMIIASKFNTIVPTKAPTATPAATHTA